MKTTEGVGRPSLRPLGLPRSFRVRADVDGLPLAVARERDFLAVEQIDEAWRVAEAWWRPSPSGEGLARTYFRVILAGGRPLTLFRDDEDGQWYEQRY